MKRLIALSLIFAVSPAFLHAEPAAPAATSAAAPAVTSKTVQVEKIEVGTAIENRELSGTASEFDASVGQVYCWTKVSATQVPAKIQHIWYVDDQKQADVSLGVNYPSVRTWSSKKVWPGRWKVDVTDESGMILSSVDFAVKKEVPVATPHPQ